MFAVQRKRSQKELAVMKVKPYSSRLTKKAPCDDQEDLLLKSAQGCKNQVKD